jgi:hypothetical protein
VNRPVHLVVLSGAVAWLAYTKLYFVLHPAHLTFDPSLIMYLTGKPDPTCGLTRTFAWMWRGDLGQAVAVYPIGPLFFAGVLGVALNSVLALASGRRLRLRMDSSTRRLLIAIVLVLILVNWIAKLAWLGM